MDSVSSVASLRELPDRNQRIKNGSLRFWKTFINFGYFSLLVPFRMEQSSVTGFYRVTTNLFQRIGCLIIAVIMTLNMIRLGKSVLQHVPSKHYAAFYFVVASFLLFIINHCIFFYNFWCKSTNFHRLFDLVLKSYLFNTHQRNMRKDKCLAVTLCVVFSIFALISFLEVFEEQQWDIKVIFNWFMRSSDELLFSGNRTIGNEIGTKNPPSASRIAMTVLFIAADAYSQLLLCYGDLLFTLTVLFYRDLVNSYVAILPRVPHHQIMEHYQELNTIVQCVNEAMGLFTFGFGMGTLPYYLDWNSGTGTLFQFTTFIEKFKFFVFCTYNTGFLLLAARYQSKIESGMRKWYFSGNNYAKLEISELTMLFNEIEDKTNTGISAFGFFTITFKFLGSFAGLLLTYTLILIDFKN